MAPKATFLHLSSTSLVAIRPGRRLPPGSRSRPNRRLSRGCSPCSSGSAEASGASCHLRTVPMPALCWPPVLLPIGASRISMARRPSTAPRKPPLVSRRGPPSTCRECVAGAAGCRLPRKRIRPSLRPGKTARFISPAVVCGRPCRSLAKPTVSRCGSGTAYPPRLSRLQATSSPGERMADPGRSVSISGSAAPMGMCLQDGSSFIPVTRWGGWCTAGRSSSSGTGIMWRWCGAPAS